MVSPLDGRYYKDEFFMLSEEQFLKYCFQIEVELLKFHMQRKGIQSELNIDFGGAINFITEEEKRTHHQIKAVVNVIRNFVPQEIRHLVHLGVTSSDIMDTAHSLMVKNFVNIVVHPLTRILFSIERISKENSNVVQIGRTHGQHGIPIKFSHFLNKYRSRIDKSLGNIFYHNNNLRGKMSGAMGSYSAMKLIVDDPIDFEAKLLAKFELGPSEVSSQIVEPEYMLRLLLEINIMFGIFANLADDLRHLQRTEIDEVRERFDDEQVGSSTMPHKRNPWNCEHVKSMWKVFSPRVMTFYMDQISEHQRDLTNSASSRFIYEYLAGFYEAVLRMDDILGNLSINTDKMKQNITDTWKSEVCYIVLAELGYSGANDMIREVGYDGLAEVLKKKVSLFLKKKYNKNLDEFKGEDYA